MRSSSYKMGVERLKHLGSFTLEKLNYRYLVALGGLLRKHAEYLTYWRFHGISTIALKATLENISHGVKLNEIAINNGLFRADQTNQEITGHCFSTVDHALFSGLNSLPLESRTYR